MVTRGHAPAIRSAGMPAAGKTGTSSATMDTWFIGYTSRWMTSTWIGDDLRERPLGHKDAAFMLTVPMFARYMTEVTAGQPLQEVPWAAPAGREARRHRRQAAHDDGRGRRRRASRGEKPPRPVRPAPQ